MGVINTACLTSQVPNPGGTTSGKVRRYNAISGSGPLDLWVKPVSPIQLVNELAAAWCAVELGVSHAEAYVIEPTPLWRTAPDERLFGSENLSLRPYHELTDDEREKLFATEGFARVFTLDVLLANRDRTAENMRCSAAECWAFDHDKAFVWHVRTPTELRAAIPHVPSLHLPSELCRDCAGTAPPLIEATAKDWASRRLDFDALDDLAQYTSEDDIAAVKEFLDHRLKNLPVLAKAALAQA